MRRSKFQMIALFTDIFAVIAHINDLRPGKQSQKKTVVSLPQISPEENRLRGLPLGYFAILFFV